MKKCTQQCQLALWVVRVWGSRWFSNKEREKTNTCLGCFLPPLRNTLSFTQATIKTTITHNNVRHCHVSFSPFVRQPFRKQLYINTCLSRWLRGPMDKASDYESGDSRFESWRGRSFFKRFYVFSTGEPYIFVQKQRKQMKFVALRLFRKL